jgi:DNA-binding protein HU-beta
MTKAELIDDISRRSSLSRAEAKAALDAFMESVTAALKQGQNVRLTGFGMFTPVELPGGLKRNPRTGAQVKRPASRTARFRIGDSLKSALN